VQVGLHFKEFRREKGESVGEGWRRRETNDVGSGKHRGAPCGEKKGYAKMYGHRGVRNAGEASDGSGSMGLGKFQRQNAWPKQSTEAWKRGIRWPSGVKGKRVKGCSGRRRVRRRPPSSTRGIFRRSWRGCRFSLKLWEKKNSGGLATEFGKKSGEERKIGERFARLRGGGKTETNNKEADERIKSRFKGR